MDFGNTHLLHIVIPLFFDFLILCLFVRVILMWLPLPSNPVTRFFTMITAPIIDPIAKRMPPMAVGMLDIGGTVAFLFGWWLLGIISAFIVSALPLGW